MVNKIILIICLCSILIQYKTFSVNFLGWRSRAFFNIVTTVALKVKLSSLKSRFCAWPSCWKDLSLRFNASITRQQASRVYFFRKTSIIVWGTAVKFSLKTFCGAVAIKMCKKDRTMQNSNPNSDTLGRHRPKTLSTLKSRARWNKSDKI